MSDLTALQRALLLIDEMQSRIDDLERGKNEPTANERIAVVGIGCRYPGGVNDPETFWHVLHNGIDAVSEIPRSRWNVEDYYDPDPDAPGKMTTRHGGFLDDVDRFDAAFFRISPHEAMGMDPQQRVLLEVAWEALENAGIAMPGPTRTGVFVGITNNDYLKLQLKQCDAASIDSYHASGSLMNVAAGRLSYILGFQGPSMAVDTACSSSLTATHLACQSLRTRECNLALACGVSLILSPELNINLSKARMMAADGRCKTFDAAADGYVRGEGCGVVVLQRLSDAVRDGNRVLAVIRGSAVNNDGHGSGLTVPNGLAQQEVIRLALKDAGVDPADVSYVEAHGTGTPLGDPIEARALAAVLSPGRDSGRPFALGSVKTNFGHTEAAAGVAGLIKVVLSMQHGEIPPHLHFHTPNPDIPLDAFRAFVPVKPAPWPRSGRPRIACVSSFGFSGTNAHVVMEEAAALEEQDPHIDRPLHLLTLSARSDAALTELAARYSDYLGRNPSASLADICFTANTGRFAMPFRLAAFASTPAGLRNKLGGCIRGQRSVSAEPKAVFLFTGQGSQYAGMARTLYETHPSFRASLERCQELLRDELDQPLLEVMLDGDRIDQTIYTQPAIFALEYSLAELWKTWGVHPAAVMGHSLGEYVAACVAGVFSLEDGLKLVAARARLTQGLAAKGAMVAFSTDESRVAAAIASVRDRVSIGVLNGPSNVVISGDADTVQFVEALLAAEGIVSRALQVSHAFHSPLMEPMLAEFEQRLKRIPLQPPRVRMISNLTGNFVSGEVTSPRYWVRQIRETVRFAAGIESLRREGFLTFLEIGPHPVLTGMARRCVADDECLWLSSLRRGADDLETMFDSLGRLYVNGASIDWRAFDADFVRRKLALPAYPFQRERYWLEESQGPSRASDHPVLGTQLRIAAEESVFENRFSAASPVLLDDHRIHGTMVVPASCYTSMVLSAALRVLGPAPLVVTNLVFPRALLLRDEERQTVQLVLKPESASSASFQLFSREESVSSSWVLHAAGDVESLPLKAAGPAEPIEAVIARCLGQVAGEDFYAEYRGIGYDLGPLFRWIDTIWRRDGEAVCRMKYPAGASKPVMDTLHPGLIDACLQLLCHGLPQGGVVGFVENGEVYIPLSVGRFEYHRPAAPEMWCHVRVKGAESADNKIFTGEFRLFGGDGTLIASAEEVRLIRATREALFRPLETHKDDWLNELTWMPQAAAPASRNSGGRWAILPDRGGIGAGLAGLLESQGCVCDLNTGEDFRDYDGVVDLRCVDSDAPALENCARVLAIVQSLARRSDSRKRGLWVVTRDAQRNPSQSAVWGLGRVASAEHPELWRGLIDLESAASAGQAAELLRIEIQQNSREDQVAFADGVRRVARMAPLALRRAPSRLSLPSGATYLVTGGFGALGMAVAGMLADRGARNIVLLGRNPPGALALQNISEMEKKGVRVMKARADVSSRRELSAVFETIQPALPPLRGVIHAAGVLDDALLLNQTRERFRGVFAPKADGAWNLHELCAGENLDFFVLFSSFVSLMGLPGESNYAAANAFLDTLAHYRRGVGLPALSINWGPWAESGMAARHGVRGMELIQPSDGLRVLEELIGSGETQVSVMPGLRTRWRAIHPRGEDAPLLAGFRKIVAPAGQPARFDLKAVLAAESGQRERMVESAIADAVSRTLSLPATRLAVDIPLSEHGLDSLSAFGLINRIKAEIGVSLPIQKFLGGADIRLIAREALQELLVCSLTVADPSTAEHDYETVEI